MYYCKITIINILKYVFNHCIIQVQSDKHWVLYIHWFTKYIVNKNVCIFYDKSLDWIVKLKNISLVVIIQRYKL